MLLSGPLDAANRTEQKVHHWDQSGGRPDIPWREHQRTRLKHFGKRAGIILGSRRDSGEP